MRKVILAAMFAATTFLSSFGAFANTAEFRDRCSMADEGITFNKPVLSERDECWLDVYRGDESHGVLGQLFWVNVNDTYYSARLSKLRSLSDPAGYFKSLIMADVSDMQLVAVRESAVAKMESAEVRMEEIVEEIIAGVPQEQYDMLVAERDMLKGTIATLEAMAEADSVIHANMIAVKDATIQAKENQIASLKASVESKQDYINQLTESADATQEYIQSLVNANISQEDKIEALASDLVSINNAKVLAEAMVSQLETKVSGLQSEVDSLKQMVVDAGVTEAELNAQIEELKMAHASALTDEYNEGYFAGRANVISNLKNAVKVEVTGDPDLVLGSGTTSVTTAIAIGEGESFTIEYKYNTGSGNYWTAGFEAGEAYFYPLGLSDGHEDGYQDAKLDAIAGVQKANMDAGSNVLNIDAETWTFTVSGGTPDFVWDDSQSALDANFAPSEVVTEVVLHGSNHGLSVGDTYHYLGEDRIVTDVTDTNFTLDIISLTGPSVYDNALAAAKDATVEETVSFSPIDGDLVETSHIDVNDIIENGYTSFDGHTITISSTPLEGTNSYQVFVNGVAQLQYVSLTEESILSLINSKDGIGNYVWSGIQTSIDVNVFQNAIDVLKADINTDSFASLVTVLGNAGVSTTVWDAVNKAIDDAVAQAYGSGFNDGFEAGYKVGYIDGRNDAIAEYNNQ